MVLHAYRKEHEARFLLVLDEMAAATSEIRYRLGFLKVVEEIYREKRDFAPDYVHNSRTRPTFMLGDSLVGRYASIRWSLIRKRDINTIDYVRRRYSEI